MSAEQQHIMESWQADHGEPVVVLDRVRKTYGPLIALEGLSLQVPAASITCLVGPNGAGKTTAVECVEGLRHPDSGTVRVFGLDPHRERQRMFQRVGVQLQEGSLQDRLRVGEIVSLFASFYDHPADGAQLLQRFALAGKEKVGYGKLSGGQKRRLQILVALIGNPDLVILDEPTSGLDPQARHNIWVELKHLRDAGKTVLVTTHYLEEAEDHADWVTIIDDGRMVASDAPARLLDAYALGVRVWVPAGVAVDLPALQGHPAVARVEPTDDGLLVYGPDDGVRAAVHNAGGMTGTEVRRARLEDLFLLLTGREYREE